MSTPACGWEVDDLVRELNLRPDLGGGLVEMRRTTDFGGALRFDTHEQAVLVGDALVDGDLGAAMGRATESVEVAEQTCSVRFAPVDDVELVDVGDGRRTACILYMESSDSALGGLRYRLGRCHVTGGQRHLGPSFLDIRMPSHGRRVADPVP